MVRCYEWAARAVVASLYLQYKIFGMPSQSEKSYIDTQTPRWCKSQIKGGKPVSRPSLGCRTYLSSSSLSVASSSSVVAYRVSFPPASVATCSGTTVWKLVFKVQLWYSCEGETARVSALSVCRSTVDLKFWPTLFQMKSIKRGVDILKWVYWWVCKRDFLWNCFIYMLQSIFSFVYMTYSSRLRI